MPVLGVTGGVGCGKSAFSSLLSRLLGAEVFDTDVCARELVGTDPEVRAGIRAGFGSAAFDTAGNINREELRKIVFSSDVQRQQLESILHPRIRDQWKRRAADYQEKGKWIIVEIPLLFETGAEKELDIVVVVACAPDTQRDRLVNERHLSTGMAQKIVAAQMPLTEKMSRAPHVIWNDGARSALEAQAELLSRYLLS